MTFKVKPEQYLLLYIPWLLSLLFSATPIISYLIAWVGSFYIFFLTIGGHIRPIPNDLGLGEQLMRPLFLNQIIFAGYMCCTSIFFFLDVLGFVNFVPSALNYSVDLDLLELVATCQRYYCLGHAAFVTGILVFMKYPIEHVYSIEKRDIANLLLIIALATLPLSLVFLAIPGLSQFYIQFSSLSFIAGTLALAFAIPMKKPGNIVLCSMLYLSNASAALLSGFKEPIIISILVLGVFLYPTYKKAVLVIFIPTILVLFILLPTYNRIFREKAWSGENSTEDAAQLALNAVTDQALSDDEDDDSYWIFLTGRLSEISMFTQFVSSTPEKVDYYNFQLVKQSVTVIIPRIFWPQKPSTEELIMERVYNAGVINRASVVSAKPPFIVDGYLSWGAIGVFLSLLLYGATAQLISLKAERLFGGYLLGTALIYSGLFQILWRGISFEFVTNSVFWSFISMLIIHKVLRFIGILKKV